MNRVGYVRPSALQSHSHCRCQSHIRTMIGAAAAVAAVVVAAVSLQGGGAAVIPRHHATPLVLCFDSGSILFSPA